MQKNSRWNKDYTQLDDAETHQDRAIERLEQVLERNPNNDEAQKLLARMQAAKAQFANVMQALLE